MADNSFDSLDNQNFNESNFDSSNTTSSEDSTSGPGPVPRPKKKPTNFTGKITKESLSSIFAAPTAKEQKIVARIKQRDVENEKYLASVRANAAAEKKQKDLQKYAPTRPIEEKIFEEHGADAGLQFKKDQERLNQLKSKQFSSLIGENFEDFYSSLINTKTREEDGTAVTYLLNTGKEILAGAASAVGAIGKASYDKYTKGRFSDKEEIEFEKLNKKINEVEKPLLIKQKKELELEFDKAAKAHGIDKNKVMYNTFDDNEKIKYKIANNYQRALSTYDDAIEGAGFWSGLAEDKFGMLQALDDVEKGEFYKYAKDKENAGQALTPAEEELYKSYVLSDRAVNGKLNNNKNYELAKGLRMSVEFMGEMALGGGFVNAFTKKAVKSQLQKDLINVLVTPALQASTYGRAAQTYSGSMQMTEGLDGAITYYTTDKKKNKAVKEIDGTVKYLKSEIERLKASGDTSDEVKVALQQKQLEVEYLLGTKDQLVDENGKLRQSQTGFGESMASGYVENLKEGFTERFVGQGFDKVVGKAGKAMTRGTGKVGDKLQKLNDFMHNTKGIVDNAVFNNTAGRLSKQFFTNVGPAKVLHSLPAEMFEEIAINFLPSVGGNYKEQIEQLGDADFYSTVAAQTLLMGGGTQAFANTVHYGRMWKDKEYRDSVKEKYSLLESVKNQYRNIDKAISDDVLAKDISMSTLGTIHQVQDYQTRIAELRNPQGDNPEGLTQEQRDEKADLLERNSFINMSIQAIQMGTENDLRRSLQKLSQNKNVSEETRKNAAVGIESLKTYENILTKNKDLINSGTVADLEIRKSLIENTMAPISKKLEEAKPAFQSILDRYNENVEVEEQMSENDFYRFLSSALEKDFKNIPETFFDFLAAHEDKKAVRNYMDNAYVADNLDRAMQDLETKLEYETNPANKKAIKAKIKAEQDAAKVETVTPGTAETVKGEINNETINAQANNEIDNKVAESHRTHPADNETQEENLSNPETNTTPQQVINTTEFFGDAFEPANLETPETQTQVNSDDFLGDPSKDAVVTEQENLLKGQELFAPVTYNKDNDAHKKQVEKISTGIRAMKSKNPNVNFDGLVALLRSDFGSANIEQSFNIIAQAWNQSTQEPVSQEDIDKVYADNFGTNTFDRSMFASSGITEVVSEDSTPTELVKSEESSAPAEIIGLDPVTGRVGKIFSGFKIADGGIKVALLGTNYDISEDGTTYETVTNEINPSALPVLHWENFKTGDKVPLGFKWDYFDVAGKNRMRIWRDTDSDFPRQTRSDIKTVVESIFGEGSYNDVVRKTTTPEGRKELLQNEDFLKIVPTSFTVNGNQLEVGINDYHWWNAANTALPTDDKGNVLPEARSRIIEAGRAYNLATRKAMASSDNFSVTMEVSERREGFHNKLLPENAQKFNSIEEAFGNLEAAKEKTAIVLVGKNNSLQSERVNDRPVIKIGGKQIFTTDIRNYDAWVKSMEDTATGKASGKVAMVTQSGVKNGKPIYTIHSLINNHLSQAARFTVYNDIHDKVEQDKKLYQKLIAEGKAIPEDLQKKEDAFRKMGLSLKDSSTFNYFKKFYTEKRKVTFKNQAEVDKYNVKISDPTKHRKIGDSRYITNDDVTDQGAITENMFRQDYDPEYSSTKRAKNVIDILEMNSPEEFYENLLAGSLKTTDYKSILLKNLHTQYIFNKIEDGVHDPIYTTETQPIISFNNNHLPVEQVQEVQKSGIDTTTLSEKIVQEKTVLNKQLETEKAELEATEDQNSKQRIEKRIATIEKKIDALPAVTVQERIEQAAAETIAEVERDFTDSDLIDINNELVFRVISKIDISKPFTKLEIAEHLLNSYNEFKDELAAKGLSRELMYLTDNEGQILGRTSYDGSAIERIDALLELNEEEEVVANAEFIKDQNKESFENNMIKYLSGKVRMLMAGIPDTRGGNGGFPGTQQYMPFPQSVDALQQILSVSENNTLEAIINHIDAQIAINPVEFGFYNHIKDRLISLEKNSPDTLNEILYFLYQPKTEMIFLGYEGNKNKFKATKMDANSKNASIIKMQRWGQQLKNSPILSKYEEGYFRLNGPVVSRVNTLYDSIKANKDNVDVKEVEEFLSYFGISLNPATLQKMKENEFKNLEHTLYSNSPDTGEAGILKNNGLIDLLKKNLDKAAKENRQLAFNRRYVEDDTKQVDINLLTSDTNNVLKSLINADNLMSFIPMQSMYIAGKMINSYQQPKSITNTVSKLLHDPKYLEKVKNTSITSESIITEMLEDNPEFREYFDVVNISLEAVKKLRDSSRDDMGITNLSEKDQMITTINLFAHNDGKIVSDKYKNDLEIDLRKGVVSFPTPSDSSQLPMVKTVLLDIQKEHLNAEGDRLNDDVLGLMFDKMVLPELKRVADSVSGDPVNIKGYNTGAKFITSFGSLNTLLIPVKTATGDTIKMPLIEVFKHYGNESGAFRDNIDNFYNEYREDIFNEIQANVNQEVDRYISKDGTKGLFIDNDIFEKSQLKFIDDQYIKSKTGSSGLPLARLVSYDYVVNYMITQRELQTLFAGDIANYFKDNMGKKLSTPTVDLTDLAKEYYPELAAQPELLETLSKNLNSPEAINFVKENYPELLSATTTALNSLEQRYIDTNTILKQQVADMMKDVQNNLSKRLKELISPGNKFPNSAGSQKYYQIMLNDVDSSSETLKNLIDISYPGQYDSVHNEITEFKNLDNIYESNRTDVEKKRHQELLSKLQKQFPAIDGYFKNASTDAQEYTTWRDNLGQLKSQGRVTPEQYNQIYKKLEAQENDLNKTGIISDNNRWSDSETELRKLAVMQPSKPLYSGLHYSELGGKNISRYIYIKSSSFPLLPEMTAMFPKLEGLRKSLSSIEEFNNEGQVLVTARASYDSANKVGAARDAANVVDLYSGKLDRDTILSKYAVELDRNNFFIQQDKPFKSDKNADAGKLDTNNRATQFEKIILGDGINKIEEHVFPNKFDQSLLDSIGVEVVDGMVNGPALSKIYNEIYRREQIIKNEKLLRRFGIQDLNGLNEGNVEGMKELIKLMKERLNNKQDKEALELLYDIPGQSGRLSEKEYQKHLLDGGQVAAKAMFKIPIYMMPNSKKFESVLNSVINKNNINLKLPGFSSPVASQEGFDFKGYSAAEFEKAKANGLIVTKNFDPNKGLQSTRTEDGKLKHAQVFIANKFKVYNSDTNTYDYIDLKQFVDENGIIDTNKLPEELLSMFSFRIPTSSHQSGALIEIAGFLPHTSADLMIVPKDHTTQIGEDYDIDTRYVYQYNYFQDAAGNLQKMSYDTLENLTEKAESERITQAYNSFKQTLKDTYFNGQGTPLAKSALAHNRETMLQIANLQNIVDNWNDSKTEKKVLQQEWELDVPLTKNVVYDKIRDLEFDILPAFRITEEYGLLKDQLSLEFKGRQENIDYYRMLDQKGDEEKILENNLISIYKTVYDTQHKGVQSLITKVLSTDNAEGTAKAMDNEIKSASATGMYNIYSPHTQSGVMRAGASGKIGIGEHSNAVTANSLFQQSPYEHKLISHFKTTKEGDKAPVYFNIRLGKLTFDGILGKTEVNGVRISELGMEDQNSSTDNQKLEIMDRRNENSNTMTVLKMLHANGIDKDGISINGKQMSYASLFINQPIIRKYSELMNKYKSSTSDSFGDIDNLVEQELIKEFGKGVEWKKAARGVTKGKLSKEMRETKGPELTSEKLWDGLLLNPETDFNSQWYVYESFKQLQSAAKKYNEVQQFINIEKNGMGVSYFDSITLADKLINFYYTDKPGMTNIDKLFGDYVYASEVERQQDLIDQGYVRIKLSENHFIKPETHYAHKIVNAITNGYNLYNSLFPYDHKYVREQIEGVFESSNTNPNTKAGLELKYKIISNLKDYVYSNNKTLFEGDLDNSIQEVFFDNNDTGNQSLASYLMDLQKNPEYNRIFRDPFFKDLQFDINEGNFPSLIKFNNSDISTLNNLDIHNIFLRMLDSEKELPPYNGKPYNNDMLLRDLLKYSLLGDQGNGAIGFRHLIPLRVFDKYNVSNTVRNSTDVNNGLIQNIIYNGPYKALESLLNSEVGENGVIENRRTPVSEIKTTAIAINKVLKDKYGLDQAVTVTEEGNVILNYYEGQDLKSAYVKQFFQHNPKEVAAYNYPSARATKVNKLQKLLNNNGFTLEMLNEGKVTNFYFEGELYAFDMDTNEKRKISDELETKDNEYAEYVQNPFMSLKNKNGDILLYEKKTDSGYYEQIPVLGVFGFNEYQVGRDIETSKVNKNNPKLEWSNKTIIPGAVVKNLTESTVEEIIQQMSADKNGPYAATLDMITPLVDYSNTTAEVVEDLQGNASYTGETTDKEGNVVPAKIRVNKDFLESGITREELQAALTEEIIHHATVTTFNKYITFTGIDPETGRITYDVNKDSEGTDVTVPSEMMTLINVYQKAFDTIAEKQGLPSLVANINNTKSDIEEKRSVSLAIGDQTDAYRVSNIHEFIAGVFLKNSDFAKEMATTPYMSSGKSVLEKFTETLTRLFNRVLPNKRTDTISAEVVRDLHALLTRESFANPKATPTNKTEVEMKKAETVTKKADDLLKEFEQDVKPPTEITDKPLVDTWKGFWTRKDVENNPDKVFLFGDNFDDAKTGYVPSSTQAVIRGLPNAIGISTKNNRGKKEDVLDEVDGSLRAQGSYLTNNDFIMFKEHVDEQIAKAIASGKTIVLPADGIGTGKAELEKRAPKLLEYLNQRLKELTEYSEVVDGKVSNTITYTPKGKQKQTYTIKGKQIFNSKGVEVFKEDSADRRKIFGNYAVQQNKAVVVEFKDAKYVVNKKGDIMSVTTGDIVFKDPNHGSGKAIKGLAEAKFAGPVQEMGDPEFDSNPDLSDPDMDGEAPVEFLSPRAIDTKKLTTFVDVNKQC